jgi:hypothetical protein
LSFRSPSSQGELILCEKRGCFHYCQFCPLKIVLHFFICILFLVNLFWTARTRISFLFVLCTTFWGMGSDFFGIMGTDKVFPLRAWYQFTSLHN